MLYIIPTIDVEGVHGRRPFDEFVEGEVGASESWGVYKIAKILSKCGVAGTFFVDVFEYTLWGKSRVSRVCKRLADMGQDVQLHTHPSWRDDPRDPKWLRTLKSRRSYLGQDKDLMAKLSLQEQACVLDHGMELMTKWLGHAPVAHRSGGYSINEDTLEALRVVGIPLDSSMNASHQNSRVVWSKNSIVRKNCILEVPVTQGRFVAPLPVANMKLEAFQKERKTDLDLFTGEQFAAYIDEAVRLDVRVCNLFMHSYSLLNRSNGFMNVAPDHCQADKLSRVLEHASRSSSIKVMSCRELLQRYPGPADLIDGSNIVPEVPLTLKYVTRHIYRKYKSTMLNAVSN